MSELQFRSHATRSDLDRDAASIILNALRDKPDLVLCVATGASPQGVYETLAQHASREPELFRSMRVCKLDEWLGLPADDPGSCEAYIQRHILGPLGVAPDNYIAFNAHAADPAAECDRIRGVVAQTGIDIAVLGVGANGHIGLNEPADTLAPFAHVAELVPSTQQHPMLTQNRPTGGVTLGMAEIFNARHVILLAPGDAKKSILQRLKRRAITTQFPVTLFWLHPNTICFDCPG